MAANVRRPGSAGYSLIEIVVVLALIGIVAAQAGPSLSGYIGRHKVRRALDRIAADLAYARMAAVRSGDRAVLRFAGSAGYRVEFVSDGAPARREVALGADHAGVVVRAPAAALEFDSRGLLVSDAGSGVVVVEMGAARDSLMITPAGRIYRDF